LRVFCALGVGHGNGHRLNVVFSGSLFSFKRRKVFLV
jgi:hypothetical protein